MGLCALCAGQRANAQTIYWTDIGSSRIQRLDLNAGEGVDDLLTTGQVFTPVDIALDAAGGKMYWTESTLADFMIQRANLDGSNSEFLIEGLTSPSGISLDSQFSPDPIPAVQEWGLIVMTLLLITSATSIIRRRRRMTA